MEKILVTGATGVVGAALVRQLAAAGSSVRCLVRDPQSAEAVLSSASEMVVGDVADEASLRDAMAGCSAVFHAAGIPEQWTRDDGVFDRVNTMGTRNALRAASAQGLGLFVHVSTQDTFDLTGQPFDETMPSHDPHPSAYEASKIAAQALVDQAGREGLNVRSVHPCAVYGPGAVRLTGMTALLYGLRFGKVPSIIDGGMSVVFNDDVAKGAILAAERGAPGSKYILSESYQSLQQMAEAVHALFPDAPMPKRAPNGLVSLIISITEPLARLTGKPPMMTRGVFNVLTRPGRPSSNAARQELGWSPICFADGLKVTLG